MLRSVLLRAALAASCMLGLASPVQADYPDRPVKLIMPYAAGAGAMDLAARLMADKLTARMGNPVIVVNQPGAGGTIAAA
ncbi:MAG: tripartite tricarboxylate transporter substrate binding protein, partial [Burkholderiaceae bacterium]